MAAVQYRPNTEMEAKELSAAVNRLIVDETEPMQRAQDDARRMWQAEGGIRCRTLAHSREIVKTIITRLGISMGGARLPNRSVSEEETERFLSQVDELSVLE